MKTINVAKPYLPPEDIKLILQEAEAILTSGMLMQGPRVEQFERAFADYVGTAHAVAVNSGTSALQSILQYYDVAGSEVIVPVNTFLASANAVLFCSGKPVFAEMNPQTLCMDFEDMKRRITPKTKGVIVVHLSGLIQPDIDHIQTFCKEHNLFMVEDAAHAHGSSHTGKRAGSLGDAAAFSFLATKVITSGGEGGMVTTNDPQLAHRVKSLRFHGEDTTRGIQDRIGHSWRMTELQAVIGRLQVQRLDEIVDKRMTIAKAYDAAFSDNQHISSITVSPEDVHAYYKYPLILSAALSRPIIKERLEKEHGVKTGTSYWPPCHLQPAYRTAFGYKEGDFPVAEDVLNRTISLPMHCELSAEDIQQVIQGVHTVCRRP
ncbi:MAG: glutamine--scyllo-inositol transaminase [Parcubacteria group bacterium Gr01-1014_70]|nr:MAG: glutamine--scyllo-inositol transaminase [Parcubacteria group bacterium Gr01-1014_70]